MSETINWRFPPLSGGTKQGFNNNDIEAFKGELVIDNLAREICQNSLDAKSTSTDGPVRVAFKLTQVSRDHFPLFDQYGSFICACEKYYADNMGHQLKNFLDSANLMLQGDQIPVLVISDYNTTGLKGSRTCNIGDPWEALTSADGISAGKEEGSGGSYGIGKNAPFACSAMRMVFYNTLDEDGNGAFIGVGRLATFHDDALGDDTQRVGRYQNNDIGNNRFLPIFPEDADPFRDEFARKPHETGTDVIIAGFLYTDDWAQNVEKAISRNFFVAIADGSLVVEIEDSGKATTIDADSLPRILNHFKNEKDMLQTLRLYEAYTHYDHREMLSVETDNDVEVRVISRPDIGKNIANFRNTGMLIDTYRRQIWQNYACVIVVREKGLSDLLKKTEPAKHDNWDAKRIQGNSAEAKKERKRASAAIKKIKEDVLSILRSLYEITPEKTVDAAGVGDYLPDAENNAPDEGNGADALRPKIKIGKAKAVKSEARPEIDIRKAGKKDIGVEGPGAVHNQTSAPPSPNPLPITPKVNPALPGEHSSGVAEGSGSKTVTSKAEFHRRTFAISAQNGLYRSIVRASRDVPAAKIDFSVKGEDGRNAPLTLLACTCDGKSIPINGNTAGPIAFAENENRILVATFNKKDKMLVDVRATEVNA